MVSSFVEFWLASAFTDFKNKDKIRGEGAEGSPGAPGVYSPLSSRSKSFVLGLPGAD